MTITALSQWSSTPGNNVDINGVNLVEGQTQISQMNNAIRELMAQVAAAGLSLVGVKSSDIASATTTDLSTRTGNFVDITGTTTITGFGTVTAGALVFVRFTGVLTLTYNATSLILPGSANITTAANDTALLVSLGSGNWQCVAFNRRAGPVVDASGNITFTGTVTAGS